MTDVTNNLALSVLKGFRQIDENGVSVADKDSLSRLLADSWALQETIKKYQDAIKDELINKKVELDFFPEIEAKVYLAEGNDKTEYNTKVIGDSFNAAGRLDDFYKIVSIQAGQVSKSLNEKDVMVKIIGDNKKVIPSDKKTVKVSKMTKEELKEAISKK